MISLYFKKSIDKTIDHNGTHQSNHSLLPAGSKIIKGCHTYVNRHTNSILSGLLDRGPIMETLPHPRDFMGPKWQDSVWSGDIKSGVCKMKCSALRFYATLSVKRSHIYMVGSGCGCLSVKQSFH